MQDKINRGNLTRIDPEKDVVPVYQTNALTQNDRSSGLSEEMIDEETMRAKREVDDNHK